jgi:hypothetical protein
LTFSAAITGLAAADITLSGVSNIAKGTVTGSNPYTLPISGFTSGGTVTVAVEKTGYTISDSSKTVAINYAAGSTGVAFTGVTPNLTNGTTTSLTLAFTGTSLGTLSANEITFSGLTGVTKGTVSGPTTVTGGVTYSLSVSGVTMGGTLTVRVMRQGVIDQSREVLITRAITFTGVSADGTIGETTTVLTLTFSDMFPGGLNAISDITLTMSGTTISKGTIVANLSNYTLPISGFTNGGTVSVSVEKLGYSISGSPRNVLIYYDTPDFRDINGFKDWLAKLPDNPPPAAAYPVKLNLLSLGGTSDAADSVGFQLKFYNNKFVNLDLSGSPLVGIDPKAFLSCTSLSGITMPTGVEVIGNEAFYGCSSLASVNIGRSVTNIGARAFYGCSSLSSITYDISEEEIKIGASAFENCTSLTNVTTGDRVTEIGDSAFSNCTRLSAVSIGEAVTSMGVSVFSGCTSLISVFIGTGVSEIGSATFYGCKNLSTVNIATPSGLLTIGASAFFGCENLTTINIPDKVITIDGSAFYDCKKLSSITIPTSVTTIGASSFNGCTSLANLTIIDNPPPPDTSGPSKLANIGISAFANTNLTSVTIPESVTTIGTSAFANCRSLTSVIFNVDPTLNFTSASLPDNAFPGNLVTMYNDGGIGTYTRLTGSSPTWTGPTDVPGP